MRASEAAPLPRDPRARHIAQGLLARPWDDRDTDAWAHTEHISGKTLQRLFIEQTGMTFGRWRTVTRMTTAADALRSGRSVAAVAHRSGYGSVASFTTAFSRHHGMPPATYRRAVTDPAALPAQLSTPSATTA